MLPDSKVTLYARDRDLWSRARSAAGRQGLSSMVERALRRYLDEEAMEASAGGRRLVLPVGGNERGDDMEQRIEFEGELLADSRGLSVEQLPRLRVFRTARGRLVVYRTWPAHFACAPSHAVYPDFDALVRAGGALGTTWITADDPFGEESDLGPAFVGAIRDALRRRPAVRVDEQPILDRELRPIRLERDAAVLREGLHAQRDLDVLLVAMFLAAASRHDARSLADIYRAFEAIKPVSRLGNMPDDLRALPAAIRGYLNDHTAKYAPSHRLFVRTNRGYWGLTAVGERRAEEVLRRVGFSRG
jgi:hypothetical protein